MSIFINYSSSSHDLMSRLNQFESKYGMTSAHFIERWVKGELDSHDYSAWAGLCYLAVDADLPIAQDLKAIAPKLAVD